jgi:DNA-binding transcriptional regulator YdaS (Cro superfamily)
MQGDEISEILGSLFVSMVSDMLSGDGLLGSSNPTPGGRTFLDNATDIANTPGGANIVANFIETVANQMTRLNTFIAQWEKIQTAALAAKASCPAINSATIDPVLSEATRELAVARTALIELQALKTRAEQAETEGNPNLLAGLLQDYGAIAVPSPVAISRAQNESRDTADLPQSGGLVQSLYTQMTELTTLCSTP